MTIQEQNTEVLSDTVNWLNLIEVIGSMQMFVDDIMQYCCDLICWDLLDCKRSY